MRAERAGKSTRARGALDVRAKLLLMLAVLSLPLLIIGLYQLHGYRASLSDHLIVDGARQLQAKWR